jgi:inosose dehydratase
MLNVQLGCQPILWGGTPFEESAADIARIGFDGIEAPVRNNPEQIDNLKRILDQTGLVVSSTYTGGCYLDPTKREDEFAAVIDVAKALPEFGCTTIIAAAGGLENERKSLSLSDYRTFFDAMNEQGRRLEDLGITQVFHNHAWTLIETRLEVDMLCEYTDPRYLKMGFDTGHLYHGWSDPVEVFDKYAERIAYVHVKDVTGRVYEDGWGWRELGAGDVNLAGILKVLDENDYDGWLTYEQDDTRSTPVESATESFAHLAALLGRS